MGHQKNIGALRDTTAALLLPIPRNVMQVLTIRITAHRTQLAVLLVQLAFIAQQAVHIQSLARLDRFVPAHQIKLVPQQSVQLGHTLAEWQFLTQMIVSLVGRDTTAKMPPHSPHLAHRDHTIR